MKNVSNYPSMENHEECIRPNMDCNIHPNIHPSQNEALIHVNMNMYPPNIHPNFHSNVPAAEPTSGMTFTRAWIIVPGAHELSAST